MPENLEMMMIQQPSAEESKKVRQQKSPLRLVPTEIEQFDNSSLNNESKAVESLRAGVQPGRHGKQARALVGAIRQHKVSRRTV